MSSQVKAGQQVQQTNKQTHKQTNKQTTNTHKPTNKKQLVVVVLVVVVGVVVRGLPGVAAVGSNGGFSSQVARCLPAETRPPILMTARLSRHRRARL